MLLRNANASPALLAQMEPVFAAKRTVASLDAQINAKGAQINGIVDDQKRLRDNLAALKGGNEERALAKRYTGELNAQEDMLATLRRELDGLRQAREAAQADLSAKIEGLSIEEKL